MALTMFCPAMLICAAIQRESSAFPMPLLMLGLMLVSAMLLIQVHALAEEEQDQEQHRRVHAAVTVVRAMRKRKREGSEERPRKRRVVPYDRERARQSVISDWVGAVPIFDDKQFDRMFRITKTIYERIRNAALSPASGADSFFHERVDCTGRRAISTDCKILMGLKVMAYGVAANAFRDYFQMGESTALLCCLQLARVIYASDELRGCYLRNMTATDAKRASDLHYRKHGIKGMIGSLDCMHVFWKNCPMALQGQYSGKEGSPTIVLEAMCDYNLWFWHASFGYAGTLNDINIWDNSPLLKMMVDGTMSMMDFEFEIGGKIFSKLWILVDGIYPELARFVKTISVPIGRNFKRFVQWQEAARKDVERAFGVFQCKFQFARHPINRWDLNVIQEIIMACIILHNM